jgi:glutathione S-transferase
MKLYYAPGACSLGTRICLNEAGISAEFERVDLNTHVTESGEDYLSINPKGSVPLLLLDDGQSVTENVAVLDFLAEMDPRLAVQGPLGRTQLIETLSFLSSELHVAFKPLFHLSGDEEKTIAIKTVAHDLDLLNDRVAQGYLFGHHFSVADAYLFTMLRWALAFQSPLEPMMMGYFGRVAARPAVRRSLTDEGLTVPSLH